MILKKAFELRKQENGLHQAAISICFGGHSEKPTRGAFVFGFIIGLPLASTIAALALIYISRHLKVLRASSMNFQEAYQALQIGSLVICKRAPASPAGVIRGIRVFVFGFLLVK